MRFIITTIVMVSSLIGVVAQPNYYDIKIREYFDDNFLQNLNSLPKFYEHVSINQAGSTDEYFAQNISAHSIANADTLTGNMQQWGDMLYSLCDMYEFTGDFGYLYEFAFQARRMLNYRGKFTGTANSLALGWVTLPEKGYMDGHVYRAISRFVYIVQVKYPLYTLAVNPNNIPEFYFLNGFSTFGDFSNYLKVEAKNYYVYLLNNYFTVYKYSIGQDNHPNRVGSLNNVSNWGNVAEFGFKNYDGGLSNLNMQLPHFTGMAYLWMADHSYYSFRDRVMQAANMLTNSRIVYMLDCTGGRCSNCSMNGAVKVFGNMNHRPVLEYLSSNNSYYWYYQGWKEKSTCAFNCNSSNCTGSCSSGSAPPPYDDMYSVEDVGHGGVDMELIYCLNEIGFTNHNGNSFYPPTEMVKYRNTFAKNIWAGGSTFYNRLNSTHEFTHNDICRPNNFFELRVFPYIKLSDFDNMDNQPSPVYSILMNHWINRVQDVNGLKYLLSPGDYFIGAARMAGYQWSKQCPDLYLRRRKVAYSQHYISKNDLIVDPKRQLLHSASTEDAPVQPRETQPFFTIYPNVTCSLLAQQKIVLKPGFKATYGCSLVAKIGAGFCTGSRNADNIADSTFEPVNNNFVQDIYLDSKEKNIYDTIEIISDFKIMITPNPTSIGRIQVELGFSFSNATEHFITDSYGRIVQNHKGNGGSISIDLTGISAGIYYFKIKDESGIIRYKRFIVI